MRDVLHVYDGWSKPIEIAGGPKKPTGHTAVITLPWGGKDNDVKVILNAKQCRTLANLLAAVATGLEKG